MSEIQKFTPEQFLRTLYCLSSEWLKEKSSDFYLQYVYKKPLTITGWKTFRENYLEDLHIKLELDRATFSLIGSRFVAVCLGSGRLSEDDMVDSLRLLFGSTTLKPNNSFEKSLPFIVGSINYGSGEFYYSPTTNKISVRLWGQREVTEFFENIDSDDLLTIKGVQKALLVIRNTLVSHHL